MGKRWTATAVAMATMAVSASSASAAVEVGNDCVGNGGAQDATFVQIAQVTPSPLPLAIPSAGVVTSWKVNSGVALIPVQRLQIFRPGAKSTQFTAVAESDIEIVALGVNIFETRVPVQAGDRIGIDGSEVDGNGTIGAAFICITGSNGDEFGIVDGRAPLGTPIEFPPEDRGIVAVSATVEPDGDGDGFGDETQDKCPRSARVQTVECPVIALSSFGIAARRSALILVASSSSSPVTISATVKVPGETRKNGKKGKARTLKLSRTTQTVAPGQLARFAVPYSAPLKAALAALSPESSLRLKVKASATDAVGFPSASRVTLRLKGQAKPE